jgi:hypothetical protein
MGVEGNLTWMEVVVGREKKFGLMATTAANKGAGLGEFRRLGSI